MSVTPPASDPKVLTAEREKQIRDMAAVRATPHPRWVQVDELLAELDAVREQRDAAEEALHTCQFHIVDYSEDRTIALVALGLIGQEILAWAAGKAGQ